MKKFPVAALLVSAAFATAATADETKTTLTSLNGKFVLTGVLLSADAESYTLETSVGTLRVEKTIAQCSGYCPTEDLLALPLIEASADIGQDS